MVGPAVSANPALRRKTAPVGAAPKKKWYAQTAVIGLLSFLAGITTVMLFQAQVSLMNDASSPTAHDAYGLSGFHDKSQLKKKKRGGLSHKKYPSTKNVRANDKKGNVSGRSSIPTPSRVESSYWKMTDFPFQMTSGSSSEPSILPFGLSVNHLQRIEIAGGALPEQVGGPEDFLPVVLSDNIQLRFRLKPTAGASSYAAQEISAYQIKASHAYTSESLWDTGKVEVSTMPDHVAWGGPSVAPGSIIQWTVSIWDFSDVGPAESAPTKFGVGPSDGDFKGSWIAHPTDQSNFKEKEAKEFWGQGTQAGCDHWKARRPLPLARAKVDLSSDEADNIRSAMLVVSGLGAFSTTFDGKPLSSSSAMDPPLTEFSQRISYRGYDVTPFLAGNSGSHVIGVALGSGWFDARPLEGGIIKHKLLPRGPLTTVAELRVTMKSGETKILAATGQGDWQMAKGPLLDSDIFTGDVLDLGREQALQNWDAPTGWSDMNSKVGATDITWINPIAYSSNIDVGKWREIITGRAVKEAPNVPADFDTAPLGKLVPIEAPPVMPVERMPVESMTNLGNGRWMLDFGKAISGVVRFDNGLPQPMKPAEYPRAHGYPTEDPFISVVYGESIQMESGDINMALVAGMGLHDGGARHNRKDVPGRAGPCYPQDHGPSLAQRDVFIAPKDNAGILSKARKSSFTTHGFRFAEVCCSAQPPTNAHAVLYRTAFEEWGKFDSSHINLNGAHQLIRNAFNSNLLGVQSDCPHREKLQYGGDLMADSPAAMHLYDMGAFYNKVIHDWTDTQWDNGAYTETTPWHDLNDYAGIGHGAGETVWASLPAVLSVRHMQHYGEIKLLKDTLDSHIKWMHFLQKTWPTINWDKFGGLGDWLAIHGRDTYLTHHSFYMATARSVAYVANQLKDIRSDADDIIHESMRIATSLRDGMVAKYMPGVLGSKFAGHDTPNADIGLYARIVPGRNRCTVLKNWVAMAGGGGTRIWPGDEEQLFFRTLKGNIREEMIQEGLIQHQGNGKYMAAYREGTNTPEGILAIRYALKTLSDTGFHHVALNKVTGRSIPSVEFMLSHNATTMWETWWRSEDVYSRNHPMLGAIAEWLPAAVAGVALAPRTTAGRELQFWPRIPTTSKVLFASATQGTKRGDASIAWRFVQDPGEGGPTQPLVTVQIRLLVPPSSVATFRVPTEGISDGGSVVMEYASSLPNLDEARVSAEALCMAHRKEKKGFSYNWEYDRAEKLWDMRLEPKAIGTPCESYLFDDIVDSDTVWASKNQLVIDEIDAKSGHEVTLTGGLYQVTVYLWKIEEMAPVPGDYHPEDIGPFCKDTETFEWDLYDANYII